MQKRVVTEVHGKEDGHCADEHAWYPAHQSWVVSASFAPQLDGCRTSQGRKRDTQAVLECDAEHGAGERARELVTLKHVPVEQEREYEDEHQRRDDSTCACHQIDGLL